MCLGAILWARIDRVWYAATQAQATAAGFDDSDFYAELARPGGERRVATIRSMAERAEEPFDAWREFSGRVQY